MLTDAQKRALLKRGADMLEKIGVAGLAVGLFQGNTFGAAFGFVFAILSFAITYYLER